MNGYDTYEEKVKGNIRRKISHSSYPSYLIALSNHLSSLSDNSIYHYIDIVNDFLATTGKQPETLSLEDYDSFMVKKSKFVASHQVLAYHALSHFSEYMFASGKADKNWMQFVKRPKSKESRQTRERRENGYLDEKQIKEFLNNVRNGVGTDEQKARQKEWRERDVCLMLIALTTGLRRAALYKLDVDDIDLEHGTITVVDKGDKIQEYNIPSSITDDISKWLTKRVALVKAGENALFISNRGTRMTPEAIYACVRKYSANIEGKHISPHKLRASYATALYNKTHDVYFVSQAMGHSGVEVTKLYIRGKQNQIRKDAAELINGVI